MTGATVVLAFETMAQVTGRAPRGEIFLSQYPGEPTVLPPPAPEPFADLYSLHVTDMGLVITYRWVWDEQAQIWDQHLPLIAETLQLARENVPPGARQILCPPEFGIELYEVLS
jgi:hypothetical protein